LDPSFGSEIHGGEVTAIQVQSDGRLVVGGTFNIRGMGPNLVRLTGDGALDPTFTPTSGVPWKVTELAVQPDGKILAGNKGGVDGGYPTIGLSRFLPDGSRDPSFQFGLPTNSIDGGIWSGFWSTALSVQSDGKMVLAGYFERDHFDYWYWSAVSLQRLAPEGSGGEFFNLSWPSPQYIGALLRLPDQSVIVAGDQLARLNADGTEDARFVRTILPRSGSVARAGIECCVAQPDGRILIGGNFTNIQGHARCRIARILPDGQLDRTFTPPVSAREGDPNYTEVRTLAIQADGRILVGGNFETIDGLPYTALARLNYDGSLDTSFPPVVRRDPEEDMAAVNTIVIQDGERALAGGVNMTTEGSDPGDLFRIYLGEVSPRLTILPASSGIIQLRFLNPGGDEFSVLKSTDLSLGTAEWTVLGRATSSGGDLYQFTEQVGGSEAQSFYRLQRVAAR
jgi:uncharacterized delta-60 repeat protein